MDRRRDLFNSSFWISGLFCGYSDGVTGGIAGSGARGGLDARSATGWTGVAAMGNDGASTLLGAPAFTQPFCDAFYRFFRPLELPCKGGPCVGTQLRLEPVVDQMAASPQGSWQVGEVGFRGLRFADAQRLLKPVRQAEDERIPLSAPPHKLDFLASPGWMRADQSVTSQSASIIGREHVALLFDGVLDSFACLTLQNGPELRSASASPLYIQLPRAYAVGTVRIWGMGLEDAVVSLGPDGVQIL